MNAQGCEPHHSHSHTQVSIIGGVELAKVAAAEAANLAAELERAASAAPADVFEVGPPPMMGSPPFVSESGKNGECVLLFLCCLFVFVLLLLLNVRVISICQVLSSFIIINYLCCRYGGHRATGG